MNDKPTIKEILLWLDRDKYSDDDFRRLIAPFVLSEAKLRNGKHCWLQDLSRRTGCTKCQVPFSLEREHEDCPVPLAITDCLEKVAFDMRDRCREKKEWAYRWLSTTHNKPRLYQTPEEWIVAAIIAEVSNE